MVGMMKKYFYGKDIFFDQWCVLFNQIYTGGLYWIRHSKRSFYIQLGQSRSPGTFRLTFLYLKENCILKATRPYKPTLNTHMRNLFLLSILVISTWLGASAQDAAALIKEGIALHDKGELQEAINKYDAALVIEPANFKAMYEKSLSLVELKKYDDAEELSKKILKESTDPEYRRLSYINYGTLLDYQDEGKKALKMYDRGIAEFPDSYLLYYNKGITLAGMRNVPDAIECMQQALQRNPYHASSHNALGRLIGTDNRISAFLSLYSFLLIESKGQRAVDNSALLNKLLMQGVKREDGGSTTININASLLDKKNKKQEDDFSSAELLLSLMAASNEIPDSLGTQTRADTLSYKVQLLIGIIGDEKRTGKGFAKNFYVPFFTEMKKNNLVTIASHIILSSSEDPTITGWLEKNKDDVEGFYRWFENYQWEWVKK